MSNEAYEKAPRSLVKQFYTIAESLGVDEAIDRILKTSKLADEWLFRRLRGWAGELTHLREGIETHFFSIGTNWSQWAEEVWENSASSHP